MQTRSRSHRSVSHKAACADSLHIPWPLPLISGRASTLDTYHITLIAPVSSPVCIFLQHIRRSRYKVVWDWGRTLYKWGAVSYSALQLYEHPWLVRALLCAIWTSSKMALGILV
eukprot:GHUV01041701.1.p1 GENE.GHUV01041701.1~~GHUV01041701.1.p1  ORF type:complete len:114 (-),score=25.67 GHUV01041701.1:398-739(-)